MIHNILQYAQYIFILVGIGIVLVLGGFIWAWAQIKNELKKDFLTVDSYHEKTKEFKNNLPKEFVTINSCQQCTRDIRESFHQDIDKKYDKLAEQIKQNRDERLQEIKDITSSNIRLETKVDMILKGLIKYE